MPSVARRGGPGRPARLRGGAGPGGRRAGGRRGRPPAFDPREAMWAE